MSMSKKILYQWAGVGILSFVGWGLDMIPNNTSWIPSVLSWSIAGLWFLITLVYILTHKEDKIAKQNIYGKIHFACHLWENSYFFRYPEHRTTSNGQKYSDVWEEIEKTCNHVYSLQEWKRYRPLFNESITEVNNKLIEVLKVFSNSIDEQFKIEIYNTTEQLKICQFVYSLIPKRMAMVSSKNNAYKDKMFSHIFSDVVMYLSSLSRKADKLSKVHGVK